MKKDFRITNMERINKASFLEVIDQTLVKLDGTFFIIKRHSDKTILIYDQNDKVLYEPVLPLLRRINIEKKLDVDLCYPSSSEKKNTRDLGKGLINSLNEK